MQLEHWASRLWGWLRGWRLPKQALESEPAPKTNGQLPTVVSGGVEYRFGREDVEQAGTFYFKTAILDDLKEYFRIIRRLKHCDPQSYDIFSKLGATIVPNDALGHRYELPGLWHNAETQPAFGAIWLFNPEAEGRDPTSFPIRFIIFNKMAHSPPHVEQTNHKVYEVTLYHDRNAVEASDRKWLKKRLRKAGFALSYHLSVDAHGNVGLLKQLERRWEKPKRAKRMHEKPESIPVKDWRYPEILYELWKENKRPWGSLEEYAVAQLSMAAGWQSGEHTGIRVTVHDREVAGVFAIDFKRSAYFFRDRDATALTESGQRKRIFHIVRPHVRKSGSAVHMHFRGLRDFTWNGYQVHVTVPGWHHTDLIDATFESEFVLDGDERPGQITSGEMAQKIATQIGAS